MTFSSVLVICAANAVTAGPEDLHQLVAELNRLGKSAAIVYDFPDTRLARPQRRCRHLVDVGEQLHMCALRERLARQDSFCA
jgi:hypothetical protein